MDDIITGRAINRVTYQTKADRTVETESSEIRAERVVPIGSHWKRLAEQGQFCAHRSTRR